MSALLTIITASYNSEKTIAATIRSVLRQQISNLEYVIIDGNSTDKTVEIIRSFEPEFAQRGIAYKWISEPDTGIYNAWNKGLKMATGRWVSFVGSDDELTDHACTELATAASPEFDFITGKARIIKDSKLVREFGQSWNWGTFQREMKILHAGGWHNAAYFSEHGNFDESFRIVGDYELLMRAGAGLRVRFVDSFIIQMGADGVSSTQIVKSLREVMCAKVKNSLRTPIQAKMDFWWVYFKIRVKSLMA